MFPELIIVILLLSGLWWMYKSWQRSLNAQTDGKHQSQSGVVSEGISNQAHQSGFLQKIPKVFMQPHIVKSSGLAVSEVDGGTINPRVGNEVAESGIGRESESDAPSFKSNLGDAQSVDATKGVQSNSSGDPLPSETGSSAREPVTSEYGSSASFANENHVPGTTELQPGTRGSSDSGSDSSSQVNRDSTGMRTKRKPLYHRSAHTDDLKQITGIGPVMERTLNDLGVTSFEQLAKFEKTDIEQVSDALEVFSGRIERDEWVSQAADLYKKKYLTDSQEH